LHRERIRANARVYSRANRARKRLNEFRRLYGLSPDVYQRLFSEQNGRCAVCRTKQIQEVDHDHRTGLWRGLVCRSCNHRLGYLDDTAWLASALAYLFGSYSVVSSEQTGRLDFGGPAGPDQHATLNGGSRNG